MASQAIDFGWYIYTADSGVEYSIRVAKQIGDNAELGFGARDDTKSIIPQGMRPRHLLLIDPLSGNRRLVKVGSVSATAWTTASTTVDLKHQGSATAVTYSQTHRTGEVARIPNPVYNL